MGHPVPPNNELSLNYKVGETRKVIKMKVTMKAVKERYQVIYQVPYNAVQTLLRYEKRIAQTVGVNGWNSDIFVLETNEHQVVISTGYNPFGKKVPYELYSKYEKLARHNQDNRNNYEDYSYYMRNYRQDIKDFVEELIELYK